MRKKPAEVPVTPAVSKRLRALEAEDRRLARRFRSLDDHDFHVGVLQLAALHEVRLAMEEQGISQAELAARLGCSRQNVHRMLTDEPNFTLDLFARIAIALGLNATLRLHKPTERLVLASGAKPAPAPRRRASAAPAAPPAKPRATKPGKPKAATPKARKARR